MLLEMHCHTAEHSACSTVPAVELIRQVYAKRLQGLAAVKPGWAFHAGSTVNQTMLVRQPH